MRHRTAGWMVGGVVVLLALGGKGAADPESGTPSGPGRDQPKAARSGGSTGAQDQQHFFYAVRHGAAKDLAAALARYYQGEAEVEAVPESLGNALLVRAPYPAAAEIRKLLEQLDQPPQAVSVEILIAEITPRKGGGGKPEASDQQPDDREFAGPADEVVAKVEALRKKGRFGGLKRIQLTALDNQPASVRLGASQPVVTGITMAGGGGGFGGGSGSGPGRVSRSITYHNTGLLAEVIAHPSPDRVVTLNLKVEDSHLHAPESEASAGDQKNGEMVVAQEVVSSVLTTTLRIPSGQAVPATGVKTTSSSGEAQTLMIVTARILETEGRHTSP